MAKTKSLKQRLKEKREELKKRGSQSNLLRQKEEGTLRLRVLPAGEDNDFVHEIVTFWLGNDIGSVISPETVGEPCALMETYKQLKESDDDDDKELAKKIIPKRKFVVPVLVYKDLKGKKVNEEDSGKLLQITNGTYQDIIDLYLDEDEWGDLTDPKKGYDIKITRDGLKMTDTNYTVQPCKNTPINKAYRKPVDLDKLVREEIDTYEMTVEKRDRFLNIDSSAGTDDDSSTKKKSKKKKTSTKKKKGSKKRKKDI